MIKRQRKGFSLIEVLIASALGVTVIGTGLWVYLQGNAMFTQMTGHDSFRQDAQLVLENVQKDLDQLIVSPDQWPGESTYLMVEPFKLVDVYDQGKTDPTTGEVIPFTKAGSGIEFFRYSHTETGPPPDNKPKIVGRKVHYETVPVDPADPSKGVNLIRNDNPNPINQSPMSEIIFQKVPPAVAQGEIGGNANAILKVTVIPKGGMWRQMREEAIQKLKEDGTVLTRVYHLSGFESQYTSNLQTGLAETKKDGQPGNPAVIDDPVVKAIVTDAQQQMPQQTEALLDAIDEGTAPAQHAYVPPPDLVKVENTLLNETVEETYTDTTFANAEEVFIDPDPESDAEVPETIKPSDKGPFPTGFTDPGQPNHCPAQSTH